ncbi:MAG TPA: hypothetical protein VD866_25315 [Urbifossiella sp.]|nr:hypothetical protein [Urbifossiella sp.]
MLRLLSAVAPLLAAGTTGCLYPTAGPPADPKSVFPVRGQVFVSGRPAAGAVVVFHPEHEPAAAPGPRPQATVRADGSFVLGTHAADDGAPAGNYVVTVVWRPDGCDSDRLGGLYADPLPPRLTTVVLKGPNDLPPFRLDEAGSDARCPGKM